MQLLIQTTKQPILGFARTNTIHGYVIKNIQKTLYLMPRQAERTVSYYTLHVSLNDFYTLQVVQITKQRKW